MIYFLQLILNVRVQNRGFWEFTFHGVHFNHDSQNSFSVHHDSWTPKMVDHGVMKISLTPPLFCITSVKKGREEGGWKRTGEERKKTPAVRTRLCSFLWLLVFANNF